jgi:hypothetical protein
MSGKRIIGFVVAALSRSAMLDDLDAKVIAARKALVGA